VSFGDDVDVGNVNVEVSTWDEPKAGGTAGGKKSIASGSSRGFLGSLSRSMSSGLSSKNLARSLSTSAKTLAASLSSKRLQRGHKMARVITAKTKMALMKAMGNDKKKPAGAGARAAASAGDGLTAKQRLAKEKAAINKELKALMKAGMK